MKMLLKLYNTNKYDSNSVVIKKIDLKLGEYADKLVNLMNNHTIIPVLIMTGLYVLANVLAGGNILR